MAKRNETEDTKAVAPAPESAAVAVPDYGEDAGGGFENQTGADIVLPFLGLLQSNSPQVEKRVGEGGLEGARSGQLHNSVTDALFDGEKGVLFVPAITEHVWVEWVPRNRGGGFVARHELTSDAVRAAKPSPQNPNVLIHGENELIETFYVYGVLLPEEGEPEPVVLAFSSTKIKKYRKWNTKNQMFTLRQPSGDKQRPPLYAHLTRVRTVGEENAKGSFYNFELEPANGDVRRSLLEPTDPRLLAAREVGEMIKSGTARASYETQTAAGGEDAGEEAPF